MRFILILAAMATVAGCGRPSVPVDWNAGPKDAAGNAVWNYNPAPKQYGGYTQSTTTIESVNAQAAKDQTAREFCGYQAGMANATQAGPLVRQAFAGIEVQAACLQFYQQTGHLPGY